MVHGGINRGNNVVEALTRRVLYNIVVAIESSGFNIKMRLCALVISQPGTEN